MVNDRSLILNVLGINEGIRMTPHQYKKVLATELRKINQSIDLKILRGERYSDDSRRHRELLRKLKRQHKKVGFFGRLVPSMSLF